MKRFGLVIMAAVITIGFLGLSMTGCDIGTGGGDRYITGINVTGVKTVFSVGEPFSLGTVTVAVSYNEGSPDILTDFTREQLEIKGVTVDDSAFTSDAPSTAPIPIVVTCQGFSTPYTYYVTVTDSAPVITITSNPEAITNVFQGGISGSLTVAVTVSGGGIPVYQWYRNDSASNEVGTPVSPGGNAESFDLPTDLTAEGSPYYYFCEVSADGAEPKRSTVAAVIVSIIEVTGVSLNKTETAIVTGNDETLVAAIDPPNATNRSLIWESNDPDRAVVIDGKVSILPDAAAGSVKITVRTVEGGFEDFCTVIVLVPEPEFTVDGIYYKLISGTNVKVTNIEYNDEASKEAVVNSYYGDINIPAAVTNGGISYDVIAIGSRAFYNSQRLLTVTLPGTIKTIEGDYAFAECLNLTSLTLNDGLETIGANAFNNCQYLTDLNFPSTITSIGGQAFRGCSRLNLTADEGGVFCTDEFGALFQSGSGDDADNAMYYLRWIPEKLNGSYIIPDGVTEICQYSVDYIAALSELTFPASITTIRTTENFRGLGKLAAFWFMGAIPPELPDGITTELRNYERMGIQVLVPRGSIGAYATGIWGTCFSRIKEY